MRGLLLLLLLGWVRGGEGPWQPPGVQNLGDGFRTAPEHEEPPDPPKPVEDTHTDRSKATRNSGHASSEEKTEKSESPSHILVIVAFFPAATGLLVCGTLIVAIFAKFHAHFFRDDPPLLGEPYRRS
jgi:hypothetical protein